jgi:hypothetical protein
VAASCHPYSHSVGDGAAVPGMAPRWRGRSHRIDGDGDAPHWSDVTALSWASVEQASVPFLRAPPSSFKGAALGPYESG